MSAGYRVFLTSRAFKDLEKLPPDIRRRVAEAIEKLAIGGRAVRMRKLGTVGWRVRVGNYRILFEIDDKTKTIVIYRIRHRREAYRG